MTGKRRRWEEREEKKEGCRGERNVEFFINI
jgi:hypothetical protein